MLDEIEIGKFYKFIEPIRLTNVGDSKHKFVDLYEDDIIFVFDVGRRYHVSGTTTFCLLSFIFEDICYDCIIIPIWAENLVIVER